MGLFHDPLKLTATARSMQQFCPTVRSILPGPAHDVVVESATVFLYVLVCRQVFGKRFTNEVRKYLVQTPRTGEPGEVAARVQRLGEQALEAEQSLGQYATSKDHEFRERIRSLITIIFREAGYPANDPQLVRDAFTPFEIVMRRIKEHIQGIKRQNHFVLKRSAG